MEAQRMRRVVRVTSPSQPSILPDDSQPTYDRSYTMNNTFNSASTNSGGWVTFTYAQFGAALLMSALGIWAMPVELMVKGYLLMSSVFLVGATFTLAKTVRDEHEAKRFAARIDEARTEKLLMEVGRGG